MKLMNPPTVSPGAATPAPPTDDLRILIYAPSGRDGNLIAKSLDRADFTCEVRDYPMQLDDTAHTGALILTAEALTPHALALINHVLDEQPVWSSLPVIILLDAAPSPSSSGATRRDQVLRLLDRAIVLHRPVLPPTLISVCRSALETRTRQYKERDLQAALKQTVARRTAKLRAVALELTRAEHEERRRLAHRLHDDLQQLLFASKMHLEMLKLPEDDLRNRKAIDTAIEMLMQSIEASRSLAVDLSPPTLDCEGLIGALRWLGSEMNTKHRLRVTVWAEEGVKTRDPDAAVFLFEATRELLFNTVKHAKVDEATVTMTAVDGEVRIAVEDHGVGLPKSAGRSRTTGGGFGLSSIRGRLDAIGGRVEMDTPRQGGCKITICAPAL